MSTLYIIKIGGETLEKPEVLTELLKTLGATKKQYILVHGGGRLASSVSEKLGIPQTMVEGRRITSEKTMEVCTMVYAGYYSKQLVARLQSEGINALGMCGADLGSIAAVKRPKEPVDFGMVGDIAHVQPKVFSMLLGQGVVPVVSAVTMGEDFQLLNTNADVLASEIAIAMTGMHQVQLLYCFEKKGVLLDPNNEQSALEYLTPEEFLTLRASGQISHGMVPKLQSGFKALGHGVEGCSIISSEALEDKLQGRSCGTALKIA